MKNSNERTKAAEYDFRVCFCCCQCWRCYIHSFRYITAQANLFKVILVGACVFLWQSITYDRLVFRTDWTTETVNRDNECRASRRCSSLHECVYGVRCSIKLNCSTTYCVCDVIHMIISVIRWIWEWAEGVASSHVSMSYLEYTSLWLCFCDVNFVFHIHVYINISNAVRQNIETKTLYNLP